MIKYKKAREKSTMSESQLKFNTDSHNGQSIKEIYIPVEVLSSLFCYYVDAKILLACRLVCKKWLFLIHDYVWYKKAELSLGKNIPKSKEVPWQVYYFSCQGLPFDKNLIKNHSGELGRKLHWKHTASSEPNWIVETPPLKVQPLPDDPVFEGKTHCFVITGSEAMESYKYQEIDLIKEGFSEYLLDYLQPKIKFSEWISCRPGREATYGCYFQLIGVKHGREEETFDYINLNKTFLVEYNIKSEWYKVEYTFEYYGKGLRKVKFMHGDQCTEMSGTKMAGACVKVKNPLFDEFHVYSIPITETLW